MNKSDTIIELAKALSKAQGDMPSAELNAVNPFFKTKYADLGSIIKTSKPVLAKHGLSVSQLTTSSNGDIGLTTLLMHESGEWLESTISLPIDDEAKNVAQATGSIITYLRRYSYASVLGIYADEDADGNDAPKSKKRTPKVTQVVKKTNGKMSLEKAQAVTTSKGEKYGDLETEKLSFMFNAITTSLSNVDDDTPVDEVAELQLKRDAIKVILDSGK